MAVRHGRAMAIMMGRIRGRLRISMRHVTVLVHRPRRRGRGKPKPSIEAKASVFCTNATGSATVTAAMVAPPTHVHSAVATVG